MSCVSTSYCGSITASIECVPKIYQSMDYEFEIHLSDEDGLPLDLNQVIGIYMRLYGEKYDYLTYIWPDTTDSEPITIIQHEEQGEQVDVGIIAFRIPASETTKMMTGNLLAELKFKVIDTNFPGGYKIKIISCLKIGEIKPSQTRDIIDF
jgi:hypothetical protein